MLACLRRGRSTPAPAKDSVEVGGSIGNHRAWAAFVQETGGVKRLYLDAAHNGSWAHPFLADRGNEVAGAGLAGSSRGDAVVVFAEKVNGKEVPFGRRVSGGAAGQVQQISATGEDVRVEALNSHFSRGHGVVMNDAGAAAVCYHDAAAQKSFIATLAPGASQWVEHPVASNCLDLVMDARGDVVSVGFNGTSFDASKIVNGQASTETISDSDSPEEPRATLDRHGDGVIVWHSNSMNDPKTAYNAIKNGQPGTATFLAKEATDSFPYATRIATGMPAVAFELPGVQTGLFSFAAGMPSAPLTLAPGMAPTFLTSAAGFAGDGKGDVIVLLFQGQNPVHTVAVLGGFGRPMLMPSAPHKVHANKRVTLTSGATDAFADIRPNQVHWTLPRGVKSLGGTHGLKLRVRFAQGPVHDQAQRNRPRREQRNSDPAREGRALTSSEPRPASLSQAAAQCVETAVSR